MKLKKLIAIMAGVFAMAINAMNASAAEDVGTFDYKAYADAYADLKAAFGYDAQALYNHYANYGKAEGVSAVLRLHLPQRRHRRHRLRHSQHWGNLPNLTTARTPISIPI